MSSLPEPRPFALARIFTIIFLGFAMGGLVIFNVIRFKTSPIILRETQVDQPIFFPSMLISVNDYARNDRFQVSCARDTRNTAAANGLNTAALALKANATRGKDYQVAFFVDPPYQKAVPYLLDNRVAFPNPLIPFSSNTSQAFDVLVTCQVNVTNTVPESNFIIGDVSIEDKVPLHADGTPNFSPIPVFPATQNVFVLVDQQYFNIQLTVSRYCTLNNTCNFGYKISFSQGSQLPAVAATTGSLARNVISIQMTNNPGATAGTFNMTSYEEYRSYGWLEVLSSVLSFFSILLLLYAGIMGGRRVMPLGFVQLVLFPRQTREYIRMIEEGAGNEVQGLRDLLFRMYLRGNYVPLVPPGKQMAEEQNSPLSVQQNLPSSTMEQYPGPEEFHRTRGPSAPPPYPLGQDLSISNITGD